VRRFATVVVERDVRPPVLVGRVVGQPAAVDERVAQRLVEQGREVAGVAAPAVGETEDRGRLDALQVAR
jgi:hypothetical protein